MAGARWGRGGLLREAKSEADLDRYQARKYRGWYRRLLQLIRYARLRPAVVLLGQLTNQADGILDLRLTRDFETAASSTALTDVRAVTLALWSG